MATNLSIDEQVAILMRGADFGDAQTYANMEKELRARLLESQQNGRPLKVYLGVDPSAPDIHLGHSVPMRKLRQFQELGHECTFLIGNFTSLIGDASDKEGVRKQLTPEQVAANAATYTAQAFKILDPEKTHIRFNADWLAPLSFADVIRLAANFTVQQFLARDNFAKRFANGDAIWLHEFLYALMQGYDALALQTDVQIGGTEQLFNLMAGRKLAEGFNQRPQIAITLPILVGTDGHLRMSKSTGNAIGINEPPAQMYGKVMSIPDVAMSNFMNLVTRWTPAQIKQLEDDLAAGAAHPRDVKMKLAFEIVEIFHGTDAAQQAEAHFRTVFQARETPEDMPEFAMTGPLALLDLLQAAGLIASRGEGRRLLEQGGIKLDGQRLEQIETVIDVSAGGSRILQVGRRHFVRLVG
ncbi:tyrosine--tRNA ligase [Candidatus Amarolinea aalborgensis]|uniref:tyrosine--tRNA ligase n=1 Tax=Candidatus Amarolinea aalborgensis TaxID=2249329 RepID=UPI003BF9A979